MASPLNVFAVKYGTLQVISAVEAVHRFGVDPETSILVVMGRLADNPCIADVPWADVVVVPGHASGPELLRRRTRQRRYVAAVSRAVAGRAVRELFLGLYSPETCAVANRLGRPAVTVLDDGTSTVYRSHQRAEDLRAGRGSGSTRLVDLGRRLGGIDGRHLEDVRFFSMFQPELAPGDTYTRCDLDFYASRMSSIRVDPASMWLYGTNIVERGHLDEGTYAEIVAAAIDRASDVHGARLRVDYHPHPRERRPKLEQLARRLGVEVSEKTQPVEMELLQSTKLPEGGIWSFPSSAIVSTSRLVRGRVACAMVSIRSMATWSPLGEVEDAVVAELGDALTVVTGSELIGR